MSQLRLNIAMITATIFLFILTLFINEMIFTRFEFARGINWIYLPAGVRLLSTLLFGGAGAVGLLIVSWAVCFFYFFQDDYLRSFMGGILAAAAPYLVYRVAEYLYGLKTNLINLTPKRLLLCVIAYAFASPFLHHIWFFVHGDTQDFLSGFFVMFAGDLFGSLIIVYAMKGLLNFLPSLKLPQQN
ncbi:hypothetical protein ACO0KY_14360 [Undibacterium sp. Dicai25W]|uniref:hypothetical protein n=1 Tax=Undibacterium sp. Dicai25W TaxID=3413034 RepID=UPI003BF174AB